MGMLNSTGEGAHLVVEPITDLQRGEVLASAEDYIRMAEEVFERRFERIPVLFDLKGRAAGMFKIDGTRRWIRFNPWIFSKYYQENLGETVPHEVAHYIVHEVWGHGSRRRRVRPHGEEWRTVMAAFGVQGEVTFNLDLEGIPQRRQKTHAYRCDCREHQVSTTRHNRIQKGSGRYHCRSCDGQLMPVNA
jgi:SprT protein